MINEQKLTRDILKRVKTIYWLKLLARPIFEGVLLVVLVLIVKELVFWQAAVFNMAQLSIASWGVYFLSAFWQTEVLVKVALVGLILFGLRLLFDLTKVFSVRLIAR